VEITGKVIECLPLKSGQSANGEWRKQDYVLETSSEYPKKVCFMAWGDKIEQFAIQKGDNLTVSIDLESREYNGRWYTDVKAWKVSRGQSDSDSHYITSNFDEPKGSASAEEYLGGDTIPF
jgi:hypothetical protein